MSAAKIDSDVLLDAVTVKTLLEKLGIPVSAELQEKIDGIVAENVEKIQNVVDLKAENEQFEYVLTPEQAETLMQTIKTRLESNMDRHKGSEWSEIKLSLEAKPEALWGINEREKAGHKPYVYYVDDEGFDVITCCKGSPRKHRYIAYNEAVEWGETIRYVKKSGVFFYGLGFCDDGTILPGTLADYL